MNSRGRWQPPWRDWEEMIIEREQYYPADNFRMSVTRERCAEDTLSYINLHMSDQQLQPALRFMNNYLKEKRLGVLMAFCFGSVRAAEAVRGAVPAPVTQLISDHTAENGLQMVCTGSSRIRVNGEAGMSREARMNDEAGMNSEAMMNGDANNITVRSMEHSGSELLYVSEMASEGHHDRYSQTYNLFTALKEILHRYDIPYEGFARTWLFADNILEWYGELNRARTHFFSEEDIFNRIIPASTGIGLANRSGGLLLLNAMLVRPVNGNGTVRMVDSPMQCSATDYKSSFSRAVEITMAGNTRLLVSGTASIDAKGETLHQGELKRQIEQTMEVVSAMMNKEGYGWDNVVRAIAYLREPEKSSLLLDYCRQKQIDSSYLLITGGTVCRDDLLFEIELDAVRAHKA